jgi:hypothetical protein
MGSSAIGLVSPEVIFMGAEDETALLVNEKEVPPFTRNEGWSERVAAERTMGR